MNLTNAGGVLQTHLDTSAPLALLFGCFAVPELFEALRQQLKQLQYMTQQRGTRGRCTFSPRHAIEELGEAGSDDDCGDENENPDFGVREVSKNG